MIKERPMTKKTVTEGSVIILPAYPLSFIAIGLIMLIQSPERTESPAFAPAKWIMQAFPNPTHAWGVIFLVLGGAELAALFVGSRAIFTWLLVVGSGISTTWAVMLFSAAARDPHVTYSAGVWVLLVAAAHMASIRSLAKDLVMK